MADVQLHGKDEAFSIAQSDRNLVKVVSKACCVYLPIAGSVSGLLFSTHITNPKLLQSLFAPYELLVSNTLLLSSHAGLGLYLYRRRHMQRASRHWRLAYSVCGSVLFNLGSVMFCAVTKVLLPRVDPLRTAFGVVSSATFIYVMHRYLELVDTALCQAEDC